MLIQKPKGTYDLLPEKAFRRTHIENKLREIFSLYNYKEIRTPAFEKTSLFKRGIGEETDIVSKEMYSFNKDEFTLKPEMTAPVVRAYLENSMYNEYPVHKLYYIDNMFRHERPQAGRFREFSQYGAEAIGSADYLIDAEMILLADTILRSFGLNDVILKINTIGTPDERKKYIELLKNFLSKDFDKLSNDSKRRFEKNPLRILDTKDESDIRLLQGAPRLFEHLNEQTKIHFNKILKVLDERGVKYEVDHYLVRGFDYYTSTTFEFISGNLGAQNTLIGGGRYDLLIEQLGGKPVPAIGFAAGMERLEMVLEANGYVFPEDVKLKLYIVTMGDESKLAALGLLSALRRKGIRCETDYLNRSVKSQMKEANKLNAEFVIVLGEEELKTRKVKLKNMSGSSETEVPDFNNINDYLK